MWRAPVSALVLLSLSGLVASASAYADDPCATFAWDVSHERALFAEQAQIRIAGQAASSSPTLETDRLFELQLRPQSEVTFVAAPGKTITSERSYAGVARLVVGSAGTYRVALDQSLWVDVFANGSRVQAKDFQGRPGCNAPHKIVEFPLPPGTPITVQFSAGSTPAVKVVVTRSPAQASP